jgi:hypothetical protein
MSSIKTRRAKARSDDELDTPNLLVRRQVPRVLPLPQYKSVIACRWRPAF